MDHDTRIHQIMLSSPPVAAGALVVGPRDDQVHMGGERSGRRVQSMPRTRTKRALDWFAKRQFEVSIIPILFILMLNAGLPPRTSLRSLHPLHRPSINPTIHLETIPPKFLYISYVSRESGLCLKGKDDVYLLVFWLLAWTALREGLMRYLWRPLGRYLGATAQQSIDRFAEQGWSVAYYMCSWTAGLYILATSPYKSLRPEDLFGGYPHFALTPFVKFYYLVQIAFWLQQLLVLNIEKRRTDYHQMLAHHCITIFLVVASYSSNFTRIGNAILVTMDFSDILLSLAKMLRYVHLQTACDIAFGLFVVSWFLTRHILFGRLVWMVFFDTRRFIEWRWDPAAGWFWSPYSWVAFNAALLSLQVIVYKWGFAIARVTYSVLAGHAAADTRSDSEGEQNPTSNADVTSDEDADHPAPEAIQAPPAQAAQIALNGNRPEAGARRRRP